MSLKIYAEPMMSFSSCFMKVMPFWLYLYYHQHLSTRNLGHTLQIKKKSQFLPCTVYSHSTIHDFSLGNVIK